MMRDISLTEYKKTYRKVEKENELRRFFIHLTAYVLANIMMIIINFVCEPNNIWFYWPLLGWGAGVLFHYMYGIRLLEKRLKTQEAEVERRVRRLGDG